MTTEKTIEALNREAREALDRLADRREALAREHAATELAAERQKEREEERIRRERAEAAERENERLRAKAAELGERRLALEERAEREAEALGATLQEILALDPGHARAVRAAHGRVPEQRYSQAFARILGGWFRGKFREVVPGIGVDNWEGNPTLAARDALTPAEGEGGGG
jgi:chromosome segregation ATPase